MVRGQEQKKQMSRAVASHPTNPRANGMGPSGKQRTQVNGPPNGIKLRHDEVQIDDALGKKTIEMTPKSQSSEEDTDRRLPFGKDSR
jgi:hypothetical protein